MSHLIIPGQEFDLPEVTTGGDIPSAALYGVWDAAKQRWTGGWYYSDDEAAAADEGCRNSGLTFVVVGVNGTDDAWLEEMQY